MVCRSRCTILVPRVFFFQAEDGIRGYKVTGVQTCALPICSESSADIGIVAALGARIAPGMARPTRPPAAGRVEEGRASSKEPCMTIKIVPNDKNNPPGKLADAELHFSSGPLEGLKLIGFAVWERKSGNGRNVTFPARQYSVNGERRSFALLRPVTDTTAQDRLRDLILQAYEEYAAEAAVSE